MKKRLKTTIKLNLKKQKISKLQASQVNGGVKAATFHLGDCFSSWDIDCIYSLGKDDMINRPR